MTAHARSRQPSELALLVAMEARLDAALEMARSEARTLIDAARRRAGAADAAFAEEIARQQARIVAESAAETARQRTAIAEAARAEISRYEVVDGDVLAAFARELAAKLAAIATAEESPS